MAFHSKLLFNFFFLFAFSTQRISTLTPDGSTLLSLLDHLNVPSSVLSSWNSSDSTPCHWKGIYCDPNHNVISLNFHNYVNISGTLGKEVGELKFLETLDLSINKISGPVPLELANCTHLVELDLTRKFFTGELPSVLGNLRKLKVFSVYQNRLSGNIPESLFFIPKLRTLMLSYNQFTGVIPSSVGNMSEMVSLWFDSNQFSGTIPHSIGNCTKLKELYFDHNLFVGNIPSSLNNLESLHFLDVSSNGLDGIIPFPSRNNGKYLSSLGFSDNHFHGEIPDLGNCTNMDFFLAGNNHLAGKIPFSFGSLRILSVLDLGGNVLSGEIPAEIGNCKSLFYLGIHENQLSGLIPRELGMLKDLEHLSLHSNNLTGEIPTGVEKLIKLKSLDLSWNSLRGSLAPLAKLHSQIDVNVSNNHFDGPIPERLFKLSSFSFSGNRGLCCPYQPRNSSSCSLCGQSSGDRNKFSNRVKAEITALSVFCALVLTVLAYYFLKLKISRTQEFTGVVPLGDVMKPAKALYEKPAMNRLKETPPKSGRDGSAVMCMVQV